MGDVLFLAHRMPFPPDRGDKIRSHHLLKGLARLGRVHVGTFAETESDRAHEDHLAQFAASHCLLPREKSLVRASLEALGRGKPVSLTAFFDSLMQEWVEETIRRHAITTVFVFSGQMGQYVPPAFDGRVIVDLCDVDSAKFGEYARDARGLRRWMFAREERLLRCEEARLAALAEKVLLISGTEADLFRGRLPVALDAEIGVLRNGIDASHFDPAQVEPHEELAGAPGPHLVFTGQMDYPPNERAALWVIDKLLPAAREKWAEAQFHVVGREPGRTLRERGGERGVNIWGEVPDVRPFLAGADLVLAPLAIARGLQNKVLEAMAMERCVLLTPEAATGIGARSGTHFVIEEAERRAMLVQLHALLENPERAREIGKAARTFVCEKMDWEAVYSDFAAIVQGDALEDHHVA